MLPTKASILSTARVCSVFRASACKHRHIVSAAYSLQSEWNARLDMPALKTIDAKQLVLTMHQQTQALTPIAAIDMDILANRLVNLDLTMLPTFETVLSAFRSSQNCLRALPSTSHAIVRGLLELGELRRLVGLLSNKDEFGLFLDAHATCIAIRHALIDSNDVEAAARIACDFLLQEHGYQPAASTNQAQVNRNSLEADAFANCVAFGALHRFIVSRIEADGEAKLLSITKQADASANDPTNDIVEWVRVDAVRNPPAFSWLTLFKGDDLATTIGYALRCFVHALRSSKQNSDVQLSAVYRATSPAAQAVADNYELIALALLRRADEVKSLIPKLDASRLCSETLRICEAAGIKFPDTSKPGTSTLKQVGDAFVADVVQHSEAAQLERARQAYAAWNARRSDELATHARRFATERRRAELKAQLTTLLETEELLTFFTKQREIELRAWLAPRSRAERKRRTREQYEEELRNVLKEKARIKSYLEALPTD